MPLSVGSGHGLLRLGAGEVGQSLPPTFVWWRDFAARYVGAVCLHASGAASEAPSAVPPPTESELGTLVLTAPMMPGAEYLNADVLLGLWTDLGAAFSASLAASGSDLQTFLKALNPAWNLVGRVHFNLAENRQDAELPFAFMATYTTRLSAQAKAKHVPLAEALRDYAGAANRDKLLSLLVPVQRAADRYGWLKTMVDTGEIFHPLRWSPTEAARLLNSVPELESAGVIVRMPANWHAGRPPRPQVTAMIGARPPSGAGLDALLDFDMDVTLGGEALTEEEMAALLAGTETLVLLRGQWVEIDRPRLERAIDRFKEAQELAEEEGLSFAEAMRLLAGAAVAGDDAQTFVADWSQVSAGPWLAETLKTLRNPEGGGVDPGPALKGTLRAYQKAGVEWLHLLSGLGLGACLADDMGLGKTIQVLSLLLIQKRKRSDRKASLLVAPASLLANWAAEIERFAPDLKAKIVHSSAMTTEDLQHLTADGLSGLDLAITSYGSLLRMPTTRRNVMALGGAGRGAGDQEPSCQTDPGGQGPEGRGAHRSDRNAGGKSFGRPMVDLRLHQPWPARQHEGVWSLYQGADRAATQPLWSTARSRPALHPEEDEDRQGTVIADLPDKTEVRSFCPLSRKQAALYSQTVADLAEALEDADGIRRRGIVLATMMRLKQICNHPSQWLNDNEWAEEDSGKWGRLREIAEVVATRQEKMLVFTQFRETTAPLAAYLGKIFGRPGLVLHGNIAVKDRKSLVRAFQEDETVPFFVLSLKAGGSGLTLTAASHVVHFDRWWNPAVENQATDRAFRIGQKKNVLVHKFVCQGTVEEQIDAMIEAKKGLSEDVMPDGDEINLTEMKDEDLMRMVALDVKTAMEE